MPSKDPEKRRAIARKSAQKTFNADPEKFRERWRLAYAENPEKAQEKARQWRLKNPEKTREIYRRNNAKRRIEQGFPPPVLRQKVDPEEIRKKRRKRQALWGITYRAKQKDFRAQMSEADFALWQERERAYQRLYQSGRRARQRGLPATFTKEQERFMRQYWGYACAVCGNQEGFEWSLVLDHWVPIKSDNCPGTIATNILPLCHGKQGCNNFKNSHDGPTWLRERYGTRKARKILKTIAAYFEVVRR